MEQSPSRLVLGPCEFDHHVQKIQVVERKAIEVLDTVRSSDHFIKDSGESSNIVEIKLLFSNLDEINEGVKGGLRGLIALFRTCPIVHCYNVELSKIFQDVKSKHRLHLIPVILKTISLETVPELVNAIQATLLVEIVDVSMFFKETENPFPNTYIQYQGSLKESRDYTSPYWLTKWITKLLDTKIPLITESDFINSQLSLYVPDITRLDLIEEQDTIDKKDEAYLNLNIMKNDIGGGFKTLAHSCTVSHKFALNKPMGKAYPYPTHMGSTARYCSFDFVFNNQVKPERSYNDFDIFYYIKEYTDNLRRSALSIDKALGIKLNTPLTKLLSIKFDPYEPDVFCIAFLNTETSDQPNLVNTRIDLVENNITFREDNQVLQVSGGTDIEELRKYYDKIVAGEKKYRSLKLNDPESLSRALAGIDETGTNIEEYRIFWPIEDTSDSFRASARLGLLNVDTFRATLLHPKIDRNGRLMKALMNDPWATGTILTNNENTIGFFRRLGYGFRSLYTSFYTLGLTGLEPSKNVYDIIAEYVDQLFVFNGYSDDTLGKADRDYHRNQIIDSIFVGFYGDYSGIGVATSDRSVIGNTLVNIANLRYKIQLQPQFTDALFNVIVERAVKPPELPYIYNEEGVHTAFFKLIHKYVNSISEKTEQDLLDSIKKANYSNNKGYTTFPDLILPTYIQLYEDRWREFAPTYQDLGIDNEATIDLEGKPLLAVSENDIVSPACWFYIERTKDTIKKNLSSAVKAYKDNRLNEKLSISIPFSTEDLDIIDKSLLTTTSDEEDIYKLQAEETLAELIEKSLLEVKRTEPHKFREIYTDLESINQEDPNGTKLNDMLVTLKTNYHHNGNRCAPKRLSSKGLGGIIYRKAKEIIQLSPVQDSSKGTISTTSVVDKTVQFKRGMIESSEQMTNKMLDQVGDFYYSPERMFPAAKVYLIDRRGNDVVSDDVLFQINPIISIDITLDKDDADLAVIKLADPLYQLQTDFFTNRNLTRLNTSSNDIVLNSLRDNRNSLIKRYKLEQGRPIQIRIGYSSVSENLPIVFTGRITEIMSGEELVIVAQGWKAELINRQVSFVNRDNNSVGARDLAIQTVSIANPDGIGDIFGIKDTSLLLRSIPSNDISSVYTQIIANSDNIQIDDGRTSVGILDRVWNWVRQGIGLGANNVGSRGLDTRLKNIWYPDVVGFNNLFGWRDMFGVYPDFLNDSWVIPIQPAWDVLKEASRAGWNCIVQVVPFDTQATLFMGNPDQPYYYTRGNPILMAYYNKRQRGSKVKNLETIGKLLELFSKSEYFNKDYSYRLDNPLLSIGQNSPSQIGEFESLNHYIRFNTRSISFKENSNAIQELDSKNINVSYLFSMFFDIPQQSLLLWHNHEKDIKDILVDGLDITTEASKEIIKRMMLALDNADASNWIGNNTGPSRIFNGITFTNTSLDSLINTTLNLIQKFELKYKNIGPNVNETVYYDTGLKSLFLPGLAISENTLFGGAVQYWSDLVRVSKYLKDSGLVQEGAILNEIYKEGASLQKKIINIIKTPKVDGPSSITSSSTYKQNQELKRIIYNKLHYLGLLDVYNQILDSNNVSLSLQDSIPLLVLHTTINGSISGKDIELSNIAKLHKDLVTLLQTKNKLKKLTDKLPVNVDLQFNNSTDKVIQGYKYFNAYVYFLYRFLKDTTNVEAREIYNNISNVTNVLPPNMRPFRVIHYLNNKHNIIKNEIKATTREMWNTVVVEHPSEGDVEGIADGEDQFSVQKLTAGANWVYFPTQEVTGVIGLQFNPALTLANKKIEVFTELNCQTKDMAAKLACHHLAEGIKRMYRGTMLLCGMHIKPHDVAILNDTYRRLSGPVEIESVVHHFNTSMGWVTNVIPQAMASANPRASILEVALLEATYQSVYNTIEFMSDAATIAAVIVTLGAATPLAVGKFSIKKGGQELAKNLLNNRLGAVTNIFKAHLSSLKALPSTAKKAFTEKGLVSGMIGLYGSTVGGLANNLMLNEFLAASSQWGLGLWFKHGVISSFVETAGEYSQLPVILSPLRNGMLPYTAGLETQDSVFAIPGFGTYYTYKQMQQGYSALVDELLR